MRTLILAISATFFLIIFMVSTKEVELKKEKIITVYTVNDIYFINIEKNLISTETGDSILFSSTSQMFQFVEETTARDANNPVGLIMNEVDSVIFSLDGDSAVHEAVMEGIKKYNITDGVYVEKLLHRYNL